MARHLRIEFDGALYHVTSRGNDRKAIFKDDGERELFLQTLAQLTARFHWLCHAYCLRSNHYHLVIETPDANLSKGMRQLKGVYPQAFNMRHRGTGQIILERFKGIFVQRNSQFLEVCRYVVLNPVRAKMVGQPSQWKWSSFRATIGSTQPHSCLTVDEILSHFGRRSAAAQQRYSQFVQTGIGNLSIWDGLEAQSLLGVEGFAEGLRHHLTGKRMIREIPKGQRLAGRPALAKLFAQKSGQKEVRNQLIAMAALNMATAKWNWLII